MNEQKIAELIIHYFILYGYYLVFFFLLAENTFMLGLVIPGETILLLSGFLAAAGGLNVSAVIIVGVVAATLGNNFGYLLGREGGRVLMKTLGSRWISEQRIKAAEEYFDKHGQKTVFIGRFVAGVRTFVPVLAGASRMPYLKFLAYTIASVVVWTTTVGLLGYFFGEQRVLLLKIIKRAEFAILAIIIVAIVFVVWKKRRERRTSDTEAGPDDP